MWTYPAVLKLVGILFSMPSGWFWLELSVLLFSIGAVGLWIAEARKHRHESIKPTATRTPSMAAMAARMKKAGTAASKTVGLVLLGIAIGWFLKTEKLRADYSKQYDAWKAQSADYQKAYAAWSARQPKKENR